MEVESTLARGSSYSPVLAVVEHSSGCLLVGCSVIGFVAFVVCLAVGMATDWKMTGFWLFVFVVCLAAGVISFTVVGWHVYLIKRAKDDEHARARAEIRLLNKTTALVDDAIRKGDTVDLTRNDDKGITDIKVTRLAVAQQARARQAMLPAPGASTMPSAPTIILPPRKLVTPAPYDLIDVMRRFALAPDHMFLGIDGYMRDVACDPSVELCHGAFNAASGRGKTILVRGLETQILKLGYEVVHADIKFSLIDEKGNDYRPIARSLLAQGDFHAGGKTLPHLIMREDQIYYLIEWLATDELRRRLKMYNAGDHSYSVFFLFLEELLYLVSIYKDLGPMIGRLLNVGRSLGIKVFCVAQNFQVQNLKLNSGMRENFESAWYLGGDIRSAAAVLDMSVKDLELFLLENSVQLGKGVSMFRNNNVAYDACLMRGGMASNDFVYWMLGKADGFLLPDDILPQVEPGREAGALERRESGVVVPAGYEKRAAQRNTQPLETGTSSPAAGGPNIDMNGPVEGVPTMPDTARAFEPQGDDKLLPEGRWDDLSYWYGKVGNVREALKKMGITNHRYGRHASFILEQRGYKS